MSDIIPTTRPQWKKALSDLPASPERIPAFFFAHGQPMLTWPKALQPPGGPLAAMFKSVGPNGPLAQFLQDFGKELVDKYNPRAIVVFSAHWESPRNQILVTDYGAENPLLMDYYGFPDELYELKFKSRGDRSVSQQVVKALTDAGIPARTSPVTESRGSDGRGFMGPGLDHGVFVPFKHMFGDSTDIPVVQVSLDGSLDPAKEWALGQAVSSLRSDRILVLSGGLTYHNLRDFSAFTESGAQPKQKAFHDAIISALETQDVSTYLPSSKFVLCAPIAIVQPQDRQKALYDLVQHPGFRPSHPREDHFVPLYVAAGAGEGQKDEEKGEVRILCGMYGTITAAFGV